MALSHVPVPEMPAKAAEIVHSADASTRGQVAQDVVRAVSTLARSGVLPYVLSAIGREDPEAMESALTSAIEVQPDDVLIFSMAAVSAAPGQARQITYAACKAAPESFADIVLVLSEKEPSAKAAILQGLVEVFPGLQMYLDEAAVLAGTDELEPVVKQAVQLLNDVARMNRKK